MKPLNIAFLWHMHQPHYHDPGMGMFSMPWVRLHAAKAYYDMARLAERFPAMKLTFNLVPSLFEQLDDYLAGAQDFELRLSRKNPVDMVAEEKEALLVRFFQANHDTMIRPFPRYIELLQYRGVHGTRTDIARALEKFAAQDYLDLQVLFNLAWFGFSAMEEFPELKRLASRGRYFSTDDRDMVLDRQSEIMGRLAGLYRGLRESGAADIAISPFYHPILPLVCDTSAAEAGMPGCRLPRRRFSHPEDSATQVDLALDYAERKFGIRPAGMWPSEGSVSPRALEIIAEAGLSWVATDEEILAKSVTGFDRARDLYRPWMAHGVAAFFRDHRLSDQIGFVYSRNPAATAADDFIARLKAIADLPGPGPRLVSVILDGENPWEYYPGSGRDFLETLYTRILKESWLKPVTFTDYLAENPPSGSIDSIFPGSWINGNFDTWIGDQEEADGWDALNDARDALTAGEAALDEDARAEAWTELYRAEGSDWFWWYGEDHSSINDPEFDRLFRAHLARIYAILGREVPPDVTAPIIKKQIVRAEVEPTGLISPTIDGRATTFYEWQPAGWLPTQGPGGAMSGGEPLISDIYYGFDLATIYFRFDFAAREEPVDHTRWLITIFIENSERYRLDIDLAAPGNYTIYRLVRDRWVRRSRRPDIGIGRIVELGLPFREIGITPGERVHFVVVAHEDGVEHERWPITGEISFAAPDAEYESKMWQL